MNQTIEKEAKLFEAGDYPDRSVTITEADLDNIISKSNEIPVKIEHTDTALDGAIRPGREIGGDYG